MDMLSDVVTSMRSGNPGAARVEMHGTWGWYLPGDVQVAGFLALVEGTCWMFPGEVAEPVRLEPGDVVFSPHGDGYGLADAPIRPGRTLQQARPRQGGFHRFAFGEPGAQPPVVFIGGGYRMIRERAHPMLNALPQHVHIRDGGSGVSRVLAELGDETTTAQPGTDALLPLLLDTLLLYVLRACLTSTADQHSGGWARALADSGIGAALAEMHQNPSHAWTVNSLARTARMSRATFARRFSTLTGWPPMTYLTWLRLNIAQGLLRETDLPVEAVAGRVGYKSPFAFSHAFKRSYGKPPLRYRREAVTSVDGLRSF